MNVTVLNFFKSKFYTAIILLVLVLLVGVLGYKYIANYSWIDALYMTVITITTVGYGEVNTLDPAARIFTIILILTSVIVVGYAITVITEFILNRSNFEEIKHRKMKKKIEAFSNHIIICGYGRNGRQAAKKLEAYKKPFVVIEKDEEVIKKIDAENIPYIYGNANEDTVLMEAGIEKASSLICALPEDADNLFVVLSARQINKAMNIISRASQEASYTKLKLAGANNVILPDKIGGDHMASLVVVPDLIEFIDNLSIVGKSSINIEEVSVEKLYDTSTIRTIKNLDLRRETGCTVIGYKDPEGNYTVNPEANQKLLPKSKIIVLGRPEQIQKLNQIYNL